MPWSSPGSTLTLRTYDQDKMPVAINRHSLGTSLHVNSTSDDYGKTSCTTFSQRFVYSKKYQPRSSPSLSSYSRTYSSSDDPLSSSTSSRDRSETRESSSFTLSSSRSSRDSTSRSLSYTGSSSDSAVKLSLTSSLRKPSPISYASEISKIRDIYSPANYIAGSARSAASKYDYSRPPRVSDHSSLYHRSRSQQTSLPTVPLEKISLTGTSVSSTRSNQEVIDENQNCNLDIGKEDSNANMPQTISVAEICRKFDSAHNPGEGVDTAEIVQKVTRTQEKDTVEVTSAVATDNMVNGAAVSSEQIAEPTADDVGNVSAVDGVSECDRTDEQVDAQELVTNNHSPIRNRLSSSVLSNSFASSSISTSGGLNGLKNIGNTCFLNSVVQCLSNTKSLMEYLTSRQYICDIRSDSKGALIKVFADLIQELWQGDGKHITTISFKNQIQRYAPRFGGYLQHDAQEFLRYLLEGLHEDINRATKSKVLTEIDDNLSDNQKALECWKRYLRTDDSKIVDIFVGQLKSTLQCTVCNHCSTTFEVFWDLSLPLPKATSKISLSQCLELFTKEEILDGDEMPTCSKCKCRRKCKKRFLIHKYPEVLVLHLKRFSPGERFRKVSVLVDFPVNGLDISPYASQTQSKSAIYNLYALANHSGSITSGHYMARCRNPYTGIWHQYDDARVYPQSSQDLVTSDAYLLFYEQATSTRL